MRGLFFALICACSAAKPVIPATNAAPPIKNSASNVATDATLFPLVYITAGKDATAPHCMGGYYGGETIVTVGHCLAKSASCADLTINWATKVNHAADKPGAEAKCLRFSGALATTPEADLALIWLSPDSVRPTDSLHFASDVPAANTPIFIWGPPGPLSFFLIAMGHTIDINDSFITHQASVEDGFSGSPLFAIPANLPPHTPLLSVVEESVAKGVLGIHVGYNGGVSTAISAKVAKARLDARN